jgi:hypothetical protein
MRTRHAFIALAVVLAGAGIAWGGYEYYWHLQLKEAERAAPQQLREYTANMTEVRFVRVEGDILTFSWPEQVRRNGELFIEQVEHTAIIRYRGVGRASPPSIDYEDLVRDQLLRLDMEPHPTDPSLYYVNAAFIVD